MSTAVFLVEDEPADADLICELLEGEYHIEVSGTVSEAVSTIKALSADQSVPELVILDLRLPDGTGFDVLEVIRTEMGLDQLPVVIMTNSASHFDRSRAQELDADEYQTKPMDIDDYRKMVLSLEERYLTNGS